MKKKYVLRREFKDGNIDAPISYRKRNIPSAYWEDQTGKGDHVFIETPETEEGDKQWNEIMDAIDEHEERKVLNQTAGLKEYDKKRTDARDALAVKVQAYAKKMDEKKKAKKVIMLDACEKFSISRSHYYDLLTIK